MKLLSNQSSRENILENLQSCRQFTLNFFNKLDEKTFFTQSHPDFSPIGWHLGHIAFIEACWILEQCANLAPQFTEYNILFRADGLPKTNRQNLPSIETIKDYLATIRKQVLAYLKIAPIEKQERLWRWLIQHETQHNETMSFLFQLHLLNNNQFTLKNLNNNFPTIIEDQDKMIEIPAGNFMIGNNNIEAQDNERPKHEVYLETYWIDRYPVTCGQYSKFIEFGGYKERKYWSDEAWQWLQENKVNKPLYWLDSRDFNNYPVCGVSWYEAEAYSKFVGKRLPTELEWEKAASWQNNQKNTYPWGNTAPNSENCNHSFLIGQITPVNAYPKGVSFAGCWDMLGNVWEWTSSVFAGYSGFNFYPYKGYSEVYFDGKHKVLKGGSFATLSWGLRNSFRNWYHPEVRQILAGFRCCLIK